MASTSSKAPAMDSSGVVSYLRNGHLGKGSARVAALFALRRRTKAGRHSICASEVSGQRQKCPRNPSTRQGMRIGMRIAHSAVSCAQAARSCAQSIVTPQEQKKVV